MNHRFRILNSALWLNSWLKLKSLPGAGVATSGPCVGVGADSRQAVNLPGMIRPGACQRQGLIMAGLSLPASGLDHGRALVVNVPGSVASVRA